MGGVAPPVGIAYENHIVAVPVFHLGGQLRPGVLRLLLLGHVQQGVVILGVRGWRGRWRTARRRSQPGSSGPWPPYSPTRRSRRSMCRLPGRSPPRGRFPAGRRSPVALWLGCWFPNWRPPTRSPGWLLEEDTLDELPLEEDGWELAGSPAEQAVTHRASSRAAAAKTIGYSRALRLSGFWFVFLLPIIGPKAFHVKYLYPIIYHRKSAWLFSNKRPGSPSRQAFEF